MKITITITLLCFLLARPSIAQQKGAANTLTNPAVHPPNFVYVLIDDLGWADIASYGSTFYRTPNIDRLARQGMRFTDAYDASPVCSPSRAAILTGNYPARLHLTDWLPGRSDAPVQKLLRPQIVEQLPLESTTIAEALKAAGYISASIGKWHLGGHGYGPLEQGFALNIGGDHHGVPVSYFYPYSDREGSLPNLEHGSAGEYLTDRLTDEALRFIETNRQTPFFLYLPHFAVHIPMKAKPEVTALYQRKAQKSARQHNAIYAAMIQSVDESIGRIMNKLDQLNLSNQTVFIFTSDNGGLTVEEGPHTPPTSNYPLRAGKGYLYEGGIRVPLIVKWPGHIKPGSISHVPVSGIDFFPTMMEIAGLPLKEKVDGISILPELKGGNQHLARKLYWHYPHYSNQGGKPGGAVRDGRYKLIEFYEDSQIELYDLWRDPGETANLVAKMPRRTAALKAELALWRAQVNAQMMTLNPKYK
jgi:arylsulfatase A-like enzyme